MTSSKAIVKQAGAALEAHQIGQMPHIMKWWRSIKWHEMTGSASSDAELSGNEILLYPSLARNQRATEVILREFGMFLFEQMPDIDKRHWERKDSLPTAEQIDIFNSRLNDPKFDTFAKLKDSFQTAVDRLVALNLGNAFLAHGVSLTQARGLDVKVFGATSAYATLKRYHSLVPLTTAYADRTLNASYGAAFAELIVNNLKSVREASVADALRHLIIGLADRAR